MPKKSQTKGKKPLIIILALALIVCVSYLGFVSLNLLNSKVAAKLIDTVESNGYRITYDSLKANSILNPTEITGKNIVLRKIDSSTTIKSDELVINFAGDLSSKTTISNPEISFVLSGLEQKDALGFRVTSTENIVIDYANNIFNITLPQNAVFTQESDNLAVNISFQDEATLVYIQDLHEETKEITSRSFDLKPNTITLATGLTANKVQIENKKLYFNYNNLGFNRELNIELAQILKNTENDNATNLDLDLSYKNTLTTGVNNVLKLKRFDIVNNNFSSKISADLKNNNIEIVPVGTINIALSDLNFFTNYIYDSITSDTIAPQYVKNAKFHKIYNMEKTEFNDKMLRFIKYLNDKPEASDNFDLAIKRERNSMIFFNKHTLPEVFTQFDKIFFQGQ